MAALEHGTLKPYKGTESYQVEDAELFFGRRLDAEQLLARVLSARMTLLHAQSGAGKTSLLNATVIPELERRGWTPVRILPHNDPIASARNATLLSVMPPPQAEIAAIDRVLTTIPGAETFTLGELLHVYDSMPVSDPLKRCLIAPVQAEDIRAPREAPRIWGPTVPYFCRLLRSTIDMEAFVSHVTGVEHGADARPIADSCIGENTPLVQLRAFLDSEHFAASYVTLLSYLDPPSNRLWQFFENLLQIYGARRPRFALMLVFDQFEEVFTRFIDPGKSASIVPADLPDWRLRYAFFDELKEVYRGRLPAVPASGTAEAPGELPSIRVLISMRSEYIAQLGPIREFAPELDQSVFHLKLLSPLGAREAIQKPAYLYGYRYTEECYSSIIGDLTKEDRYVEPAHLSLICEKLWDETGSVAVGESVGADGVLEIGLDLYKARLEGAKGILRAFLRDYLNALPAQIDRTESLEMLEPLITGTGTRNIVDRRQLLDVPFRNRSRRRALLQGLVDRTIVRVEVRLGGNFVEITHEFLIPSIQEAIHNIFFSDGNYQRVRAALQTLRSVREGYLGTDLERVLSCEAFLALDENRDLIDWTPFATELMLRASICYAQPQETIAVWAQKLAGISSDFEVERLLLRADHGETMHNVLSAEELQAINRREKLAVLNESQIAFVLRSQILHGTPAQYDDIRFWAERARA